MEESLVKTLAKKLKMKRAAIFKRLKTDYTNEHGTYKVLEVRVERGPDKKPLVARFGGIPLQWSKQGVIISEMGLPEFCGGGKQQPHLAQV